MLRWIQQASVAVWTTLQRQSWPNAPLCFERRFKVIVQCPCITLPQMRTSSMDEVTAELPMLPLILVRNLRPEVSLRMLQTWTWLVLPVNPHDLATGWRRPGTAAVVLGCRGPTSAAGTQRTNTFYRTHYRVLVQRV
jgi:hypothetical protein